ncbi:MAG: hypothetical protein HC930_17515, partial [Hydrococcus sp. SU_1_0]|nr:hypothetical protein [Hydrococcus sp. SU_1_0]
MARWFPGLLKQSQPWLEKQNPALWLKLMSLNYQLRHTGTSAASLK